MPAICWSVCQTGSWYGWKEATLLMQYPINRIKDKTSFRAIALTLVFVLSWLELAVPMRIPGVKFGFTNLITLICLVQYGFYEGLIMAVMKILLSTFLLNGVSSFWYTLGGTLASCLSMAACIGLYRKGLLSLMGVSAIGGFFHITVQYILAAFTFYTPAVFGFYPLAAALTLCTSVILGLIAQIVIRRMENIRYDFTERDDLSER